MELKAGYKKTEVGGIPEDWEVKKLGDVLKIIGGGAFKSSYSKSTGVKWIKIANVGINQTIWNEENYLPNELIKNNENFLLKKDDYVMALTRPILDRKLKIARLTNNDVPALLNQRVGKIEVENGNDINFAYFLFQKYEVISSLLQSMAGTDPPNLSNRGIYNIDCAIPPTKAEQAAIATALSDVDALISALDKLIAKKRLIKQGAMQELLSGKKRLAGFYGEWKIKKLADVLKVKHGKSQKEVEDINGQYPILGTGGLMGYTNFFLYDKPSVLIGRKGTIDKPQFMNSPFWTVDTLFYTEIFNDYLPKYIYYNFLQIDWYSYNEASGVPSLNAKTIENISILFPPTKEEQTAIAQILSDMDSDILALETQRNKTLAIKQGMMQNLLTGKIRLL